MTDVRFEPRGLALISAYLTITIHNLPPPLPFIFLLLYLLIPNSCDMSTLYKGLWIVSSWTYYFLSQAIDLLLCSGKKEKRRSLTPPYRNFLICQMDKAFLTYVFCVLFFYFKININQTLDRNKWLSAMKTISN